MEEKEMLDYLLSTGLYRQGTPKQPHLDLYYEQKMMNTDKTIPIRDLVERFIRIDREFEGEHWNIRQILSNIDIIIPVEDRNKYSSEKEN